MYLGIVLFMYLFNLFTAWAVAFYSLPDRRGALFWHQFSEIKIVFKR